MISNRQRFIRVPIRNLEEFYARAMKKSGFPRTRHCLLSDQRANRQMERDVSRQE